MLKFRGSKVFETRPFDIDFVGQPRDLLVRERQIGEYFHMKPSEDMDVEQTAKQRDIYIFSMESDDFEKIRYEDVVNKCDITDGRTDHHFLLARPFATYNMASAVLMKSGLETGFTAHGHHDFMLTDDVIHKCHIGHYTFYHKSIVKQPKNIMIAEDIFAHSYVRGEGVSMFSGIEELEREMSNDRFTKDILVIHLDPTATVKNPVDLCGSYSDHLLDTANVDLDTPNEQTYTENNNSNAVRAAFQRLRRPGGIHIPFLHPLRELNTVCFQGHQINFCPLSKGWTAVTINTGHWGPNVYPGCRSVRNGENAFLKDMEYEKNRCQRNLGN